MLIPKKDRITIYTHLFKGKKNIFLEGVMCTKDDVFGIKSLGKDQNGEDVIVKNLYVIKLLQSLHSRGYVRKQYSWTWYYYFLTDAGVAYLRDYLHLPSDVVPDTQQVTQQSYYLFFIYKKIELNN